MKRHHTLPLALGTLIAAMIGVGVQKTPMPSQPMIFWAITFASVSGLLFAIGFTFKRIPSATKRLGLIVLSAVLFRISYFPLMVFAGFVAALAESVVGGFIVWPTFLVFLFLANVAIAAGIAVVLGAPLTRWTSQLRDGSGRWRPLRWAFVAFAVSQMALATTVSFSTANDFTWLPDRPRPDLIAPPISKPVSNPYRDPDMPKAATWAGAVLRLAAGSTYDFVPASPWSNAVKGTLEALTRVCPVAGSDQRIADHHAAYLAAHILLQKAP